MSLSPDPLPQCPNAYKTYALHLVCSQSPAKPFKPNFSDPTLGLQHQIHQHLCIYQTPR